MQLNQLPFIGAALPGGLYAGVSFNPDDQQLYAVVLADAKPPELFSWADAQAWAKGLEIDGLADFKVPDRLQSLLLFHTLHDQFEKAWHWTSTQYSDADYAWCQYFNDGSQYPNGKSYEGRVRAVRLIPITA